jgi:hypothetical protein
MGDIKDIKKGALKDEVSYCFLIKRNIMADEPRQGEE